MITRKDLHLGIPKLKAQLETTPIVEAAFVEPASNSKNNYQDLSAEDSQSLLEWSSPEQRRLGEDVQLPPGGRDSLL